MAMKIFENKKHVFWQALFLTLLFFFLGIVLGIYVEQIRADSVNVAFYQSETSLYDSFALGKLIDSNQISCGSLRNATVDFADRIYGEAKELEQFESSNKITDSVKIIHKKYDLLRTLLWMNILSMKEKCGEVNTVVYLYNYSADDIETKSKQDVWSKVLQDLKNSKGNDIILLPIAVDQNVSSLNYLINYDIKKYPAVLINEKKIFYEPQDTEKIESYLN